MDLGGIGMSIEIKTRSSLIAILKWLNFNLGMFLKAPIIEMLWLKFNCHASWQSSFLKSYYYYYYFQEWNLVASKLWLEWFWYWSQWTPWSYPNWTWSIWQLNFSQKDILIFYFFWKNNNLDGQNDNQNLIITFFFCSLRWQSKFIHHIFLMVFFFSFFYDWFLVIL
jgi:hypothetical protein